MMTVTVFEYLSAQVLGNQSPFSIHRDLSRSAAEHSQTSIVNRLCLNNLSLSALINGVWSMINRNQCDFRAHLHHHPIVRLIHSPNYLSNHWHTKRFERFFGHSQANSLSGNFLAILWRIFELVFGDTLWRLFSDSVQHLCLASLISISL